MRKSGIISSKNLSIYKEYVNSWNIHKKYNTKIYIHKTNNQQNQHGNQKLIEEICTDWLSAGTFLRRQSES